MSGQRFGTVFDDAASPGTVRKREANLHAAVAEKKRSFLCSWELLLGVVGCLSIVFFGWCTFIPFPAMCRTDEPNLSHPPHWFFYGFCGHFPLRPCDAPPWSPDGIIRASIRYFANAFISVSQFTIFVCESNILLLRMMLEASSFGEYLEWLAISYLPRMGSAFGGVMIANVCLLLLIGLLYTLVLVCAAGTCRVCRKRNVDYDSEDNQDE
jgi:hypothetical protein